MKRFLTAAAVCVLLPAVAGPVRNGSFESFGGNGVPENWTFTRSNDAPVTVFSSAPGADGEKCLRVVSRMERKIPHTFGLLSQTVKLKPDTDYVFVFSARGRNVGHVGWAFGKGWLIRHPVTGVTEEWREFRVPLRIPADRMEGRESCGVRLIVEGVCGGTGHRQGRYRSGGENSGRERFLQRKSRGESGRLVVPRLRRCEGQNGRRRCGGASYRQRNASQAAYLRRACADGEAVARG